MIRIEQLFTGTADHDATLSLTIESRVKSRLKVTLDDGREAGLFLQRGQVLRGGDLLQSTEGLLVRVLAAAETVSTCRVTVPILVVTRAARPGRTSRCGPRG